MKEYLDEGDNYQPPERKFENDILDIRLYCQHEGCKKYLKGKESYNGMFITETGEMADLRNQCWYCEEHKNEQAKS